MRRTVANMVAAKGWRYAKCGMPAAVLQEQQWDAPKAGEGEVVVKMLAAPILGEDLQMVMGTLGGLQAEAYPAVAGTQGVGEVVEVGKGALTAKGSRVLLSNYAVGSWATKVTTDAVNVQALDAKAAAALEPGQLALLPVYCSAVAMAKEYGDVKGKTAVVLGSDLPVGAALAAVLASHGASVTSIASTSTDASHSAEYATPSFTHTHTHCHHATASSSTVWAALCSTRLSLPRRRGMRTSFSYSHMSACHFPHVVPPHATTHTTTAPPS